MKQAHDAQLSLAYKYEAVFCIFLAIAAYLGKENAEMVYPNVLYLFLLLLTLNFSAILALKLWPLQEWISALVILANCGAITGLLSYSGGPQSNLWVLYLLPIYTVAILLNGREVAWITAGAISFNAIFYLSSLPVWNPAGFFELGLKSGIFIFAASMTSHLARSERRSFHGLLRQREEIERLEKASREQKSSDEQTEKLAQVGLISAGIVHDLKNPLAVIRGFANLCLETKDLNSGLRSDIERIDRAAVSCQNMVAGILSAAKNEEYPLVACRIDDILDSAAALCGPILRKSGVELRKKLGARPLPVLASPEHLQRLFLNLMGNAVQAMPRGGVLTLETRWELGLGARPQAKVIVEDTGTGLSQEALRKLFKPFGTTRPRQGGTGLGLYLCREIAAKHGGFLQAENAPSGGARFALTIPLQDPRPAAAPQPVKVKSTQGAMP